MQYVHENVVLYSKRSRAVVLIVSRGNDNNEIELGDDANRLPAPAERANPVDFTPIEPGATEPPQVSIRLIVGALDLRCRRGLDPCLRNDLAVVPATASEDELADFRHVARSQTQPTSGVGIASDPRPLCAGYAQGLEQCRARKFVEGASRRLTDYGRHQRERAGVVEEFASCRGRHRTAEDVATGSKPCASAPHRCCNLQWPESPPPTLDPSTC
jgi:hypothetical protein